MIHAEHVVRCLHAVTGEILRPTTARIVEPPTGVWFALKRERVVIVRDSERFDAGTSTSVDLELQVDQPFSPAVLANRGRLQLMGLSLPVAQSETNSPQFHELLVDPVSMEFDLQLIDDQGNAVRGASPQLCGKSGAPTIELSEVVSDDPRRMGHYRASAQVWDLRYHPGEIRVNDVRAPMNIDYRRLVTKRRIVVSIDVGANP